MYNCIFIVSKALLREGILLNPFATVLFSVCSAVTVECCVLIPRQPSDSSRPRQRLLLSGDVYQNPGSATTKYPCSVCTSNVTSRGVSYMWNRCSGWVNSKCSGLQNAAEYRRIKNWACSSCSSPPIPPIPKTLLSLITTNASDGDPFIILQFNTNGMARVLWCGPRISSLPLPKYVVRGD